MRVLRNVHSCELNSFFFEMIDSIAKLSVCMNERIVCWSYVCEFLNLKSELNKV